VRQLGRRELAQFVVNQRHELLGGVQVAGAGEVVPGYDETPVAAHMKGSEIDIEVDIGIGRDWLDAK